eukprot:2539363-Prymnesium_polylepis.1
MRVTLRDALDPAPPAAASAVSCHDRALHPVVLRAVSSARKGLARFVGTAANKTGVIDRRARNEASRQKAVAERAVRTLLQEQRQ